VRADLENSAIRGLSLSRCVSNSWKLNSQSVQIVTSLSLSPWHSELREPLLGWLTDCFIQGMTNLTLAPEDDDSDLRHGDNVGQSVGTQAVDSNRQSELKQLRFRFDPHKVGFGILPWPGTDQPKQAKDTVIIAMNYLADGKVHRDREDN
jgi:hypothetical protein